MPPVTIAWAGDTGTGAQRTVRVKARRIVRMKIANFIAIARRFSFRLLLAENSGPGRSVCMIWNREIERGGCFRVVHVYLSVIYRDYMFEV